MNPGRGHGLHLVGGGALAAGENLRLDNDAGCFAPLS